VVDSAQPCRDDHHADAISEGDMKKKKPKKRSSASRRVAATTTASRDAPKPAAIDLHRTESTDAAKPATVDLHRAAETLAGGKGHKAINAARQMLEAAAALGVAKLTGERAHIGVGGIAETINKLDYPDIEFRWYEGPDEPEAQAVYVAPSEEPTVYRRLRMLDADLQALAPRFGPWLAATAQARGSLAYEWWGPVIDQRLEQPSEERRFWLPLLTVRLPLVSAIAEHQGAPVDRAVDLLDKVLKEIDRTSGIDEDDRRFLISLSGTKGTEAQLIRLDRLARGLLLGELHGGPDARVRVLRLFDPDLPNAASAKPDTINAAQSAMTVALVGAPAVSADATAATPGQPAGPDEPDQIISAIGRFIRNGERSVSWQVLCDGVRGLCDGWDNPTSKTKKPKPGYSDKTIQRLAKKILMKARPQNGQ
jgi:hypothetical protein